MDTQDLWNPSFAQGENFVFYPNCFNSLIAISKLTSYAKFKAIYPHTQPIKALDFGCGIGRQTLLLSEFGIESHGIDISNSAIQQAQILSQALALNATFQASDKEVLPFGDEFFDFSISCGAVLNCMPFSTAKHFLAQLARVTKILI